METPPVGADRTVIRISMDDLAMEFCEHCGISRERLGRDHVRPGSQRLLRVCGRCEATCCPNCWNLRADRCLLCVPFSVPFAAAPSVSRLVIARPTVPPSRRAASRRPAMPAIARATTLAGVRRSLLAVGYVMVAVLILSRSPLFLDASAAAPTAPAGLPGIDTSRPATSSPSVVPTDAGAPSPGDPSPSLVPAPSP